MDKSTIDLKPRSRELLQAAGPELYKAAFAEGKSLSAYLEQEDPSEEYKDGLDSFSRLMKEAGIISHSDPARGYYASTFAEFYDDEHTRALFPEWTRRQWLRVATGQDPSTRAILDTDDNIVGGVLRPYVDSAQLRMKQLAPAIPLSELVTVTTPITGDAYRAAYLTEPTNLNDYRMARIAEGAEIPRVKLATSDHTVRLHKFGRALEATYELLRRQRLDMIALHIARLAIQAETDKVAVAIDTLVNGDGNSGTAATSYNLTTLDSSAVAGTLTLKGWINFKLQWLAPYRVSTALSSQAIALQVMLLSTGTANIPLAVAFPNAFGGYKPINQSSLADNVGFGWTTAAPANKIVAFDNRFALERVYEVGGNISEIERFIMRQTQAITMTEIEGYDVIDQNATRILVVNA